MVVTTKAMAANKKTRFIKGQVSVLIQPAKKIRTRPEENRKFKNPHPAMPDSANGIIAKVKKLTFPLFARLRINVPRTGIYIARTANIRPAPSTPKTGAKTFIKVAMAR